MGDAMRNRTCRGWGKNFIPRAKAKHCGRECRRKGYLAGWANDPERKRIQSVETEEIWSDPEQRKLRITAMLAARTRAAAISNETKFT
jgi:hypothetical protein